MNGLLLAIVLLGWIQYQRRVRGEAFIFLGVLIVSLTSLESKFSQSQSKNS